MPDQTPTPRRPDVTVRQVDDISRGREVDERLQKIYRTDEASPDLKQLERSPVRRWVAFALFAVLFAVLIAATWAGFWLFGPMRHAPAPGLQLAVTGPTNVSLGAESTFFIKWTNTYASPLGKTTIRLSVPADFHATAIDPEPDAGSGLSWTIPSLPAGTDGTITVRGIFTGTLGSTNALQAVAIAQGLPNGTDAEALATQSVTYDATVIQSRLTVPDTVLPGDQVALVFSLMNVGDTPFQGLSARFSVPKGFSPASSTPLTSDGTVTLPVGELDPGASTTVTLVGTFASGVNGTQTVSAAAGLPGLDGFLPVAETQASLNVLTGDLVLTLVADGSSGARALAPGSTIHLTLGYQNTSPANLNDIALSIAAEPVSSSTFAASPVDWTQAQASASGTADGNAFGWDATSVPALAQLPSTENGSFNLTVPLMLATTTPSFQLVGIATMRVATSTAIRTVRTTPIVFTLLTDAHLTSSLSYDSPEGAPLGSGPLPPIVGRSTTYRLTWKIQKSLHELDDATVAATLPPGVTFSGVATTTVGSVSFDADSSTLAWTVGTLADASTTAEADLNLTLTPSASEVGTFADLLGTTMLTAQDAEADQAITQAAPALNSDLENDPAAAGKGVVEAP